jgi:hypothetical protein
MTKRTRSIAIVMAIAITMASVSGADGATKSRPFGARLKVLSSPLPGSDPCLLPIMEAGTGIAAHMGKIAWAASETLNLCSNPQGADVQGEFVMTAANGDEVFGRYMSVVLYSDAGAFTFAGRWEIVGGTGRFASAIGEGTLNGAGSLAQPPPTKVTAIMVGRISY